jgi:hypothetical protein
METSLSYRARLVHAEPGRRVVQVSAWQGSSCLGSALAEGPSAEDAEDKALSRLQQRLQQNLQQNLQQPLQISLQTNDSPSPAAAERPRHALVRHEAPATAEPQEVRADSLPEARPEARPETPPEALPESGAEPPADPEDWSDELAEIDVQLKRLSWERTAESTYLQRAFGHPSRNRITQYADLSAYLRALRLLPEGSDPSSASVPLRRQDLLSQSDQLLSSLRWDASQGRQLLEQSFQLSSRQQLSDEQLLSFNMLLESELLKALESGSAATAAASPG